MQGHMSFKFVWNEMQKIEKSETAVHKHNLQRQKDYAIYHSIKPCVFNVLHILKLLIKGWYLSYFSINYLKFLHKNHCWTHGFLYPCSILELRFSDIFVKLNMYVAQQRLSTLFKHSLFLQQNPRTSRYLKFFVD